MTQTARGLSTSPMPDATIELRRKGPLRRTLAEALRSAEAHLTAAGVPSPRVDAELLAAHLLHTDRLSLWQHMHDPVPEGFDDLVAGRVERIPLQHLTGVAYFRTVELAVGPGVFSPRPETELVAGHAIDVLRKIGGGVAVDLCAGSGAIAAALRVEAPDTAVHAVERDPAAAPWLLHNAREHQFNAYITDVEGCLPELTGTVDVVVANPPYIPEGSIPRDPEVARFDPPAALYSGKEGLDHVKLVERAAARLLRTGSVVVVEHGDLQGHIVPSLFEASGTWKDVTDHLDLAGRDRYVTAVLASR
ncbi:MAG TPA: HemK/PrmC family methyltransferase [Actinomycetes bacterium]|nr:HemK/PrmC family methyltransferase [Actinomycetes bacterium]